MSFSVHSLSFFRDGQPPQAFPSMRKNPRIATMALYAVDASCACSAVQVCPVLFWSSVPVGRAILARLAVLLKDTGLSYCSMGVQRNFILTPYIVNFMEREAAFNSADWWLQEPLRTEIRRPAEPSGTHDVQSRTRGCTSPHFPQGHESDGDKSGAVSHRKVWYGGSQS